MEAFMKKILVTNEVSISEVSMGSGNPRSQLTTEIMDHYFKMGGDTFDTARVYANGEQDIFLGKWIRDRGIRNQIIVCMKGGHPAIDDMYTPRLSKAEIKGDLEASLLAAGLEYADLYLLHRDAVKLPVDDMIVPMNELIREGKTRAIGVSNWTGARIARANRFAQENGLEPFRLSQTHFSLARTTSAATGDITQVPMSDIEYQWFIDHDFVVMAFSSQAQGYFASVEKGKEPKPHVKAFYDHFPDNRRRAERAVNLAKMHGVSATAIAVAYLRAQALRTSALVKPSSTAQLKDTLSALAVDLTQAEVAYLETGSGVGL
jgi:aryl-alcohol dehydrogenase-like predicted oxidoreductase